MIKKLINLLFGIFFLAVFFIFLPPDTSEAGTNGHVGISKVDIQPIGSWKYTSSLRFERGRKLLSDNNTEYDNLRLKPMELNYGFSSQFQFGTHLTYSANSSDGTRAPDEGGIESIDFTTKYSWNRNIATDLVVGFALSDDVLPYGGDGSQLGLNIPMQTSLGPGSLTGELGLTVQSGDITQTIDWSSYLNYGIGYSYELTREWSMNMEMVGHQSTIDTDIGSGSHLSVYLKPTLRLSETSKISPSVGLGLSSGSPNYILAFDYTYRFGQTAKRRIPFDPNDQQTRTETAQKTQPKQDAKITTPTQEKTIDEESEPARILPGETDDDDTGSDENRKKTRELYEKGRTAFQQGNLDKALTHFEEALEYDSDNVEVLSNLGSLNYRKENYQEAKKYYNRALNENPKDQFANLFLGITYRKLDKTDKARNYLEKAKSIDPNSSAGQQAIRWLNRLEKENSANEK